MPGTKEKPSAEVIRYFAEKKLHPSFAWQEVWGEEHAHAFTVAKSAGFDILGDVRDAVQSAIENGETFETFQKSLEPKLRLKGWWGSRIVIDPKTGEKVRARLGSARRLKVIYEANTRTARAAGQWERAQRTKGMLPYLVYCLGPSEVHRPLHAEKEHLVLPVDDSFWDEWYPPNGWGCKCYLRQIGRGEAAALGGPSTPPAVERRPYINPRTGEETMIPRGIDPGWQTSPGKARSRGLARMLGERLETMPHAEAATAVADLLASPVFDEIAVGRVHGMLPVAMLQEPHVQKLSTSVRTVLLSSQTAIKQVREHPDVLPSHYRLVQPLLETAEPVQLEGQRLFYLGQVLGRWWRAVIKRTADGRENYLVFFHPKSKADGPRQLRSKRRREGKG